MNRLENIPEELRALDRWVVVTAGSKVPINARTGDPASSSDEVTWSAWDTALRQVEVGNVSNVGFVFDADGYVGIDIDAGYDEDGLMTPLAAEIIGLCHSYTERSRSGRGFHVIVKGDLPWKGKNNQNGVEIYKDSRYFITTGDVILYREIEENQTALDEILERWFPETERDGGGRGFQRVYSPQWEMPTGGRVRLRPVYPRIPSGCRNICLTSLAGMLHSQGYDPGQILDEIRYANTTACDPALDDYELQCIVSSVTRYKR
jgi:hypothetical protein